MLIDRYEGPVCLFDVIMLLNCGLVCGCIVIEEVSDVSITVFYVVWLVFC